jgi:hypothetical protein
MFTISLVAILVTVSVVSYKPDSPAKKMREAVVELEALAAQGHTMAMLHQKPFWLRFERNRVLLEGASLSEVNTSGVPEIEGSEQLAVPEEELSRVTEYESYSFPEGMEVFVRRWGAAEQAWFHQQKEGDPYIFWNFESNGLCEPISLRFELGESWTVLEMDPLTARIADETSEIYDR